MPFQPKSKPKHEERVFFCSVYEQQKQSIGLVKNKDIKEDIYEGVPLTYCPANLDLSKVEMVIVSGSTFNPAGHALLYVPSNSLYFHIAGDEYVGTYGYPKMMNGLGYSRYLSDTGKKEIRRILFNLPNPTKAYEELMSSTSKKWIWGGIYNNCATFVREIVVAGEGDGDISNYPIPNIWRHDLKNYLKNNYKDLYPIFGGMI